jgi:hypothetical protein
MYKARVNIWNLHKNLKKAEKASLLQKVRQIKGVNLTLFRGRPVPMHRLVRYCKENNVPTENLKIAPLRKRQRLLESPSDSGSHTASAESGLQSLFRSPHQPSPSIAVYGDTRTTEVIIWNTEAYLNYYFTTGPGTLYYEVKPAAVAGKELPATSLVLVKNERAWEDVVNPRTMYHHMIEAVWALKAGFIDSAFKALDKGYDLVQVLFKQQAPTLLSYLFLLFVSMLNDNSIFMRNVRQFILDMAATVNGGTHPRSIILNSLYTVSSTADKFYAWRAVVDALTESFVKLEDSNRFDPYASATTKGQGGNGTSKKRKNV